MTKRKSHRANVLRAARYDNISSKPGVFSPTLSAREKSLQRIRQINEAVAQSPPDVHTLRKQAAAEGGLLNSEIRGRVWPILLGIPQTAQWTPEGMPGNTRKNIKCSSRPYDHKDRDQIKLDVDRSYGQYPLGIRQSRRAELRKNLDRIVNQIVCKYDDLYYYQGFHDVCAVFQQVLSTNKALLCIERVARYHLRDYLKPTLDGAVRNLSVLFPLLALVDMELHHHIECAGLISAPHFALAWTLTWFSHDVLDLDSAGRFYDVFLAYPDPFLPVYCAVAIMHSRRDDILATEQEFGPMFKAVKALPQELLLDDIIFDALKFYDAFPPAKLIALAGVDMAGSYSYGTYPYKWLTDRSTLVHGPLAPITANLRRRPVSEREAAVAYEAAQHRYGCYPRHQTYARTIFDMVTLRGLLSNAAIGEPGDIMKAKVMALLFGVSLTITGAMLMSEAYLSTQQ